MPEITVIIEWDNPEDFFWLNADNIALALHSYCKNTNFNVTELNEEEVTKAYSKIADQMQKSMTGHFCECFLDGNIKDNPLIKEIKL